MDRGLGALEILASASEPLGVTEVARRLGVDKSTGYRLLVTLRARDYVRQVDGRKYLLGPRCIYVGQAATKTIAVHRLARPVLQELADRTGQTVHLAVWTGTQAVYVDRVQGSSVISISASAGTEVPGHATASGKAIIAYLPLEQLRQLYKGRELTRFTSKTITDLTALEGHLRKIGETGCAVDDEERYDGVRCVAAPVFDHHGTVAASISVSGATTQMPYERLEGLKSLVMELARGLSTRLGYTADWSESTQGF